LLELQVISQT